MNNKKFLTATTILLSSSLAVANAMDYNQAPVLDKLVESNALAPVEQRLPVDPLVIEPVDRVGDYGGKLRRAILGGGDQHNIIRMVGHENLVNWDIEWSKVIPNIAKSFEINDTSTEFTFILRDGMKWSDGEPFTTDDIQFWYQDVFLNPVLTPVKNALFVHNDKKVQLEIIDKKTFKFKFDDPNGLFLYNLAYGTGFLPVNYPAHYLKQFHADYNPDVDKLVANEPAVNNWQQLFLLKGAPLNTPGYWQNTDRPTLHAWTLENAYGSSDVVRAVRNPYYWKVDTAGNQLPYLDSIEWHQVEDPENILLKAISGEIDFQSRHITGSSFRSILFENQERGNYRLASLADTQASLASLLFNLNIEDEFKRGVFQDINFRKGISHAVNREEIVELVYLGNGGPSQVAPTVNSVFYDESINNNAIEYNVKLANEYLDKAGLKNRDSRGFRTGPNGEPLDITFMVADVFGANYPDVMELVQGYAKEVGINIQVRATDSSRLMELVQANQQEAYIWNCAGGEFDIVNAPFCYMPKNGSTPNFAKKWADWYAGSENGVEPPAEYQKLYDIYDAITVEASTEKQNELIREFLALSSELMPMVGLIHGGPAVIAVKNNFKNVPPKVVIAGELWFPSPHTVQYFLEGGKNQ